MTYDEFIQNILSSRGRFACGDEYCERHHILPRCCDGTDDEANLIDLFAREHFEAHRLLAIENPNNNKLVHAWFMMSCVKNAWQERCVITAEEYEEARIAYIDSLKGRPLSEETKQKLSEVHKGKNTGDKNGMFGATPWNKGKEWTDDVKQKMSNSWNYDKHFTDATRAKISTSTSAAMTEDVRARISATLTGITRSEETRQKMSESKKGIPLSEEHKKHMSEGRKGKYTGEDAPMWGKHHTEETRQKISDAQGYAIYCPELGEEFANASQASRKYYICRTSISNCVLGKQQYAGKHPITEEKLSWVKLEK